MQFVNRAKLKGKLAEENIKRSELASYLNITVCCLSEKIAGRRRFNEEEMALLGKKFGVTIFFFD